MKDHEHVLSKDCPCEPTVESFRAPKVVPLVRELRIEAAIVPHRRGELYAEAAKRIERLENILHAIIDAKHISEAHSLAMQAVGVSE